MPCTARGAPGCCGRLFSPPLHLIIVTDVGPDPDDAKALLIAGVLHQQGALRLRAVIANGSDQSRGRARLARCLLDHMGIGDDVRVGIGSMGEPTTPYPHEYNISGYEAVADARLHDGPQLFLEELQRAPARSLRVLCISSLRDLADMIDAHPDLILRKVALLGVQGGLQRTVVDAEVAGEDDPAAQWEPDTSTNNSFDMAAARTVYRFCLEKGLPMRITSRNAVPMLPMQLARSFAERTDNEVMRYLADAQFLGLKGLWQKLCAGQLPQRCTKQWFFETFCGMSPEQFVASRLDKLGPDGDIVEYLNGYVKPYDVLALMTLLPKTEGLFPLDAASVEVRGTKHALLMSTDHTIDVSPVLFILRETYHQVVAAAADVAAGSRGGQRTMGAAVRLDHAWSGDGAHAAVPSARAASDAAAVEAGAGRREDVVALLQSSLDAAQVRQRSVNSGAICAGLILVLAILAVFLADFLEPSGEPEAQALTRFNGYTTLALCAVFCVLLALDSAPPHAWRVRLTAGLIGCMFVLLSVILGYWTDAVSLASGDARASVYARADPLNARAYFAVGAFSTVAFLCVPTVHAGLLAVASAASVWEGAGIQPARVLEELWRYMAVSTIANGLFGIAQSGMLIQSGLAASFPAWYVPVRIVMNVVIIAIGASFGSPSLRAHAHALIARLVVSRGSSAGLAPLLGFGSRLGVRAPSAVVADARKSFTSRPLDVVARDLLQHGVFAGDRGGKVRRRHKSGWRASAIEAMRRSFRRASVGDLFTAALPPEPGATTSRGSAQGKAAHGYVRRGTGSRPLLRRASSPFQPSRSDPAAPSFLADAYVVHSHTDPAEARAAALTAWATAFEEAHGRPPLVWIDALCADLSLTDVQLLEQAPATMAACRRLLVLAGATLPDRLWCAAECYIWSALGRSAEHVDVAIVGGTSRAAGEAVAAFDTQHALYATGTRGEVRQRLERVVEVASVAAFNAAVRNLLPRVRIAAEAHVPARNGSHNDAQPQLTVSSCWSSADDGISSAPAAASSASRSHTGRAVGAV